MRTPWRREGEAWRRAEGNASVALSRRLRKLGLREECDSVSNMDERAEADAEAVVRHVMGQVNAVREEREAQREEMEVRDVLAQKAARMRVHELHWENVAREAMIDGRGTGAILQELAEESCRDRAIMEEALLELRERHGVLEWRDMEHERKHRLQFLEFQSIRDDANVSVLGTRSYRELCYDCGELVRCWSPCCYCDMVVCVACSELVYPDGEEALCCRDCWEHEPMYESSEDDEDVWKPRAPLCTVSSSVDNSVRMW